MHRPKQIKEAYRNLSKQCHPDLNVSPEANAQMQEINEAYRFLSSPLRKAEYDQLLELREQQGQPSMGASGASGTTGHCRCEKCGRVDRTLRVTVFTWVVSLLIFTYRHGWAKILCARCRTKYAVLFDVQNFFMGWWAIPFGVLWTFEALWNNSIGGQQPEENNALFLAGLGYEFHHREDFKAAVEALQASLKFKKDPRVEAFLRQAKAEFQKRQAGPATEPKPSAWQQLVTGALHPALYCAPVLAVLFGLSYLWIQSDNKPSARARDTAATRQGDSPPATVGRLPAANLARATLNRTQTASVASNSDPLAMGVPGKVVTLDPNTPIHKLTETALRELAQNGDAQAQLKLAKTLYWLTTGLLGKRNNDAEAAEGLGWYRRAATQGLSEAQLALAETLEYESWQVRFRVSDVQHGKTALPLPSSWGEELAVQLRKEAAEWRRKAAEQGLIEAQVKLADILWGAAQLGLWSGDIAGGATPAEKKEEAVRWFRRAAEKGDAQAQWSLARLLSEFARGMENKRAFPGVWWNSETGGSTNSVVDSALESESWKWCRKAAENTNGEASIRGDAQCRLAAHYERGGDEIEAARWWRRAADLGDYSALIRLADMHDRGRGVAQNHAEAAKLLLQAAFERTNIWSRMTVEEHADLLVKLGDRFESGLGVRQDLVEAYKWFDLLAGGYEYYIFEKAPTDLVKLANDRREALAKRMTSVQVSEGQARATVYLASLPFAHKGFIQDLKNAERGDPEAQYAIGRRYWRPEFGHTNSAEGLKWFERAAAQGHANAQVWLGEVYYRGQAAAKARGYDGPRDPSRGAMYFRMAADQGDRSGQFWLAMCYRTGEGERQDNVQAYKWLTIALTGETNSRTRDWNESQIAALAINMTPQQIAMAQRFARDFVSQKRPSNSGKEQASDNSTSPKASGSGFFISGDGYLISNFHVVEEASRISVATKQGVFPARVVKIDPANDIAVLKVSGSGFRSLPFIQSGSVKLGDSVLTIGFPNPGLQGVEPKLTDGKVNSLTGMRDDARYFQISIAVQPGNSGGALVSSAGNVVGIVTARLSDEAALETSGALPQNVNYAIKSSYVLPLLDAVPEVGGRLKNAWPTKDRKFEDVVQEAQEAAALVLVY